MMAHCVPTFARRGGRKQDLTSDILVSLMAASASRRSLGSKTAAVSILLPALIGRCGSGGVGAHEFLDAPAGLGLDVVTDGHRGEHDRQVDLDRFAGVVVDRAGL